ncbi:MULTISPECIES: TRAP transporter small permease [unclassified Chelatococcus]|uniref:TRAP transporter small permease n=1 Tax=unclassified Chelatococcus TaxID=2638111 RepID=UPI001BCE2815|nr:MULTISPECIES: TRAP transporter small permease [unclassified Chelatococcus]MBS7696476.1 TRAP transporter small permease [Chelatococcus sp. YT9]MBX3555042.1 TRAP transporter small permease [Chelatococcus sp.]
MRGRVAQVAAKFGRFAEIVSSLMFAGIFVVFIVGIAMRYLFHKPLMWTDEVTILLLLWCTFLTDAFVVRSSDHVAFDVVWDVVSSRTRRAIGIIGRLLFALVFAAALPTVIDYVLFLWRERTDVLEIRLDIVFSCFVIYMVMVVVRLIAQLIEFCGPHWRQHVAASDASSTSNVIG